MSALCPDCREQAAAAARAAVEVLADPRASLGERQVAGEVAHRALEHLQLPSAERAQESGR